MMKTTLLYALLLLVCTIKVALSVTSLPLHTLRHPVNILAQNDQRFAKIEPKIPLKPIKRDYLDAEVPLIGQYITYAFDVTLGTPGQTFRLQADTGSALMAVPFTPCTGCDQDTPNSYYDSIQSSSSSSIPCNDETQCTEQKCYSTETNTCGFSVTYGDGSGIRGVLERDIINIGGLEATIVFGGIQTQRTDDFEAPFADGIIGLCYNATDLTCTPNCISPVLDVFFQANNIPNIFSMFLGDTVGTLTLGGIDTSLYRGDIFYVDVIETTTYNINFWGVRIGGQTVYSNDPHNGYVAIVDSGTSTLAVPDEMFTAIQQFFQNNYCSLEGVCGEETIFNGNCISQPTFSNWPTLSVLLDSGIEVIVPPTNYLGPFVDDGQTYYCLFVTSIEDSLGLVILGDTIMRGNYVVFDRVHDRVGFAAAVGYDTSIISGSNPSHMISISMFVFMIICWFIY